MSARFVDRRARAARTLKATLHLRNLPGISERMTMSA
jgi:hypothetical protein